MIHALVIGVIVGAIVSLPVVLAMQAVPTPQQYSSWSNTVEKAGLIGLLFAIIVFVAVALHRQWFVVGWMFKQEREEKLMWRKAYMDLVEQTKGIVKVAESAVRP